MSLSSSANYSGKQPNNTAYVKNYIAGTPTSLWKTIKYTDSINHQIVNAITPTSKLNSNLYIPGNLYLDGSIISPSDAYLKDKIENLPEVISENIMKIRATQFVFKSDPEKRLHYGFIAQEFEEHFPELVLPKIDKDVANLKAINYLEMVPLLVYQMQRMQKEIDNLKEQIKIK
jgi:hypothetical protein